ncbi:ROK family protein, partial [Pseudomonas sp. BGM005]|nr:ROK family protein [Pseudomonas sp. BG5]
DGTEVEARRVAFSDESRERMLDAAVADIDAEYSGRLLIAGVQLPGTTDGRRVFESVQLGWTDVPLAERFEAVLGIPVLLVNDVDAEAIAEAAR